MGTPSNPAIQDAANFAALNTEKRRLKAELEKVEDKMAAIEERLLETFVNEGLQSIKLDSGTVHLIEQTWPALVVPDGMEKDEARAGAVRALAAMGHENMITYNMQSVRGLLGEADDEGHLPPPLGDWVRAERKYRIGVRAR